MAGPLSRWIRISRSRAKIDRPVVPFRGKFIGCPYRSLVCSRELLAGCRVRSYEIDHRANSGNGTRPASITDRNASGVVEIFQYEIFSVKHRWSISRRKEENEAIDLIFRITVEFHESRVLELENWRNRKISGTWFVVITDNNGVHWSIEIFQWNMDGWPFPWWRQRNEDVPFAFRIINGVSENRV